jgi:HEAT repeat protein
VAEWTKTDELNKQVQQMAVQLATECEKSRILEQSMEKIWMKFEELQTKIQNVEIRLSAIIALGAIFQTIAVAILVKFITK